MRGDRFVARFSSPEVKPLGVLEAVNWEFYDRVQLQTRRISIDDSGEVTQLACRPPERALLFQRPLGHSSDRTKLRTNMVFPGSLPNPMRFTLHAIKADIWESGLPVYSRDRIWQTSTLEFSINSKPYIQLPMHALAEGVYGFTYPRLLTIEHGENFSAIFETEWAYDPSRNFEVGLRLIGMLERGTS